VPERPLWVRSRDLRLDARQRAGRADSRRSAPGQQPANFCLSDNAEWAALDVLLVSDRSSATGFPMSPRVKLLRGILAKLSAWGAGRKPTYCKLGRYLRVNRKEDAPLIRGASLNDLVGGREAFAARRGQMPLRCSG